MGAANAAAARTAIGAGVGDLVSGGPLGTPSGGVATNLTGTAAGLTAGTASAVAVGGITGLGTGVATALAVNVGSAGAPVVQNGALGTPSSGVATNLTGTAAGLTAGVASAVAVGGITGLGTGVGTFLATPTSANLASAVTDETGSGGLVFATSPTLVTPVLGTPSSGNLSSCTADGTNAVGFRSIPQNSQSAAYTTVLADNGKQIYHPGADTTARTWTIDSNANVAYPIGATLTFINDTSAGVITIAITSDTMILAGAGTTGNRTLAANGIATAVKMTSTRWIINGTGLT